MKVSVNKSEPKRTLVAVAATGGCGIFVRDVENHVWFIDGDGIFPQMDSLKLLASNPDRVPVYEGDSVTIQF